MPARLSRTRAPLTHAPTLDKLHHSRRCVRQTPRHWQTPTLKHRGLLSPFTPLQFSAIGSGNNRLLQEWEDRNHDLHRRRVRSARSQVDTRAPRTSKLKVNRGKKFQMKVRRLTPRAITRRSSLSSQSTRFGCGHGKEQAGCVLTTPPRDDRPTDPVPRRRRHSPAPSRIPALSCSPTFPTPSTLRAERERGKGRKGEQPPDP